MELHVIKELGLKTESIVKGFCYGGLLFGVYFTSHQHLVKGWARDDYNYCYLIPPLVLYLLWDKRDILKATTSNPSWKGLTPLVFGIGLYWLGELGGEYYTMYLSSWLVLLGLCWMHLGWSKLKTIFFPIALILTMFPPPNFIYSNLSLKLKLISSRLGVWVLQTLGKTAYREGNIIDIGFTQLQVVDACNGLRYLFPLIVLAILVAYFSKSAWWKNMIVVFSAIPISIFVNGLRIASVGLLYPIWGSQVAEGFFHDFSGWVIFMISLGILLFELLILNRVFKENGNLGGKGISEEKLNRQAQSGGARTARQGLFQPKFLLAILLLGTTAAIAQTVNFREEVPITRSFNQFPLRVGEWVGQLQTMDQKFIRELDLSDYIIVTYRKGSSPPVNFYSTYYESQRKGESIHSPSSCLPGSGWEFQQAGRTEISLSKDSNIRFPVRRAVMSNAGHKQLSYYWFPMRGRVLTNIWEMKLYNFIDALTQQRTDGALARLITPIGNNETIEDADARLQGFTRELVPVLNEFLPQ
jgi:exosortase D (VPLPA-CTERM-specific)